MSRASIKPIYGAATLGTTPRYPDEAATEDVYKRLEAGGCTTIDTTHDWPKSEEWLGKTNAGTRFTVNSKTPGGIIPGQSTGTGIVQHAKELADHVGAQNVDVYNIHAPDPTLDLEDMLKGINDAYKAGYFKRFGLSNFTTEEVEQVHAVCTEKGYTLPKVYEGNYNPVSRTVEQSLFPTLRKLGISFYAYSPMAGGFLTKTAEQLAKKGPDAGRFGGSGLGTDMYNALYNKPSYLKALELWAEAAQAAGCSKAELAYRWVACDSPLSNEHGDALIFGCSKPAQIPEVLGWLKKGSVGAEARAKIDEIWKMVEHEAPIDNYQSFFKDHLVDPSKLFGGK